MPSQAQRDQLAKDWLVRMIDRTPLPEVGDLPIAWLSSQAPPLINAILDALSDPESAELSRPPASARPSLRVCDPGRAHRRRFPATWPRSRACWSKR